MFYKSTRDSSIKVESAKAITLGISADGGLFVPESFPQIDLDDIEALSQKDYKERAIEILSTLLTDFSDEQLVSCVNNAYGNNKFDADDVTSIKSLRDGRYILELWHGPTCAFKDMALQLLPHLLSTSAKIVKNENEIIILVATSGDTGKAALEGFKDAEGIKILVFYPRDGVSPMQKRQMTTQDGENVYVCAINGNFDDAQSAVKTIFTDEALKAELLSNKKAFSSANSINWGRLVPQIVYYISAYADLVKKGEIKLGDEVNVCVPTGNFGNILAAYYAKKMGTPIAKLICASNENKVLTDFINTGVYNKNREFKTTISPSMDILISSNLERLLYELSGNDDNVIKAMYSDLSSKGKFEVSKDIFDKLSEDFYGGFCDDENTKKTIRDTFDKSGYLCDTHTAVAVSVYDEYRRKTGDDKKVIIASTASPYKFGGSVLSSFESVDGIDEYDQIDRLLKLSNMKVPEQLANLKEKKVRFDKSIEKADIKNEVLEFVK